MEDMCDAIDSPTLSPLSDEQQRQLNQVLTTLNTQQLAWVSGYLYGSPRRASSPWRAQAQKSRPPAAA